jgi:sugar/nucleoside kinase (ribokinase family)
MTDARIVTMGVHVLDVLCRPVEEIPEGQGGALVDEIRITAAGTAGGTALTLRKLGADVCSAGAIGTDAAGDMLLMLLQRAGIDTGQLVRRGDVQTSASVLPIRPNGDRPSFHVIGANATYGPDDVDWDAAGTAGHLHLGGPELVAGGAEGAAAILAGARERGLTTSVDVLAPGDLLTLLGETLAPVWPHVDHALPNDEQALALTGAATVEDAARDLLGRGVGCVAITCGGDGALVATAEGVTRVPAFAVEVVDTTGCGDAFSAGFLRGIGLGRSPRDAAALGCAAAAHVAQGLGSDHGSFDVGGLDAFAAATPTAPGAATAP